MLHYSSLGEYYTSAVGFIWKFRLINSDSENKHKLWHLNWLYSPLFPANFTPILKIAAIQFHTHTHTAKTTITVFSALKYGAKSLYAARYYCLFITNTSALTETVRIAITLSQTTLNYFHVLLGLHSKYKINRRVIISDLMSDVTSINVTKVIISITF
jgi:hypothetical protein